MKHSKFILYLILCGSLLIFDQNLLAQSEDEEVIKLSEEKITELEIKKTEIDRDFNYITNVRPREKSLFDDEATLGLSSGEGGDGSGSYRPRANYFRFVGGNGYYFLGELDYFQAFEDDWFKIQFLGLSYQELSSLLNGEALGNSDKYRLDVSASYLFTHRSKNNDSYLHTLKASHTSYNIGLQNFDTADNDLFYYHFQLGYEGYYLFSSLALDHSLSAGGGNYSLWSSRNQGDFAEANYRLELKAVSGLFTGLFGNLDFDFDWLTYENQGGSDHYRFLLDLGVGYEWEITSQWILNFYLGHVLEIIQTPDRTDIDAFLPITVLPRLGLTYLHHPDLKFTLEASLKSETEDLWQLYRQEKFYDQGVFPYLNRLLEGKFTAVYKDPKVLHGLGFEAFLLYNYFFQYDRPYYASGALKRFTEDGEVNRVAAGLTMNLKFTEWLALEQKTTLNVNLPFDVLIFPLVETQSKLFFTVSKIHSRFIVSYLNEVDSIYSQDRSQKWSLVKQRLDAGYEFEYRHFILEFWVENILDNVNYQEIPDILEKGFALSGGIKYFF